MRTLTQAPGSQLQPPVYNGGKLAGPVRLNLLERKRTAAQDVLSPEAARRRRERARAIGAAVVQPSDEAPPMPNPLECARQVRRDLGLIAPGYAPEGLSMALLAHHEGSVTVKDAPECRISLSVWMDGQWHIRLPVLDSDRRAREIAIHLGQIQCLQHSDASLCCEDPEQGLRWRLEIERRAEWGCRFAAAFLDPDLFHLPPASVLFSQVVRAWAAHERELKSTALRGLFYYLAARFQKALIPHFSRAIQLGLHWRNRLEVVEQPAPEDVERLLSAHSKYVIVRPERIKANQSGNCLQYQDATVHLLLSPSNTREIDAAAILWAVAAHLTVLPLELPRWHDSRVFPLEDEQRLALKVRDAIEQRMADTFACAFGLPLPEDL